MLVTLSSLHPGESFSDYDLQFDNLKQVLNPESKFSMEWRANGLRKGVCLSLAPRTHYDAINKNSVYRAFVHQNVVENDWHQVDFA